MSDAIVCGRAEVLTYHCGVYLLHQFLSRIGFKIEVAMDVRLVQRNHRYRVGEMLLAEADSTDRIRRKF